MTDTLTRPTAVAVLNLTADRKVSPLSRWTTSKGWTPDILNAFGLSAGVSCPGATVHCIGTADKRGPCYALALETQWTSVRNLAQHNYDTLQACGDDVDAMVALLAAAMVVYRASHAKAERRTGRLLPMVFRIHWDGDYYSTAYAEAWRRVILANPDVRFWSYTRSFVPACDVTPILSDLPNLALYLSVDDANDAWARVALTLRPSLLVARMAPTVAEGRDAVVAMGRRRAPACPENVKRVPMVNDAGEGACVTCGLCIDGRRDVIFSTTNR